MRLFYILLAWFGVAVAISWAQGINPIPVPDNNMIQIFQPSEVNPSYNYTTATLIQAGGIVPTLSGSCAVVATTQAGGSRTGKFAIPAGDCAASTTVILTMSIASKTGFVCDAHNLNTPTSIIDQTAVSTTSATLTIRTVTSSAGDVVLFKCQGY